MPEKRDDITREIDDVIGLVLSGFEDVLISGVLEDRLMRLIGVLKESPLAAGEDVEQAKLLYSYVHALRVRVISLRSRRGLSRARDRILSGLIALRGSLAARSGRRGRDG